jgi:hypothetical protein
VYLDSPKERNERENLLVAVHPDSPDHLSMIIAEFAKRGEPYMRYTQVFLTREEVTHLISALTRARRLMLRRVEDKR